MAKERREKNVTFELAANGLCNLDSVVDLVELVKLTSATVIIKHNKVEYFLIPLSKTVYKYVCTVSRVASYISQCIKNAINNFNKLETK